MLSLKTRSTSLADVPLFLTEPTYRNHIVSNIRYNQQVAHYWQNDFGALPLHQQTERAQALKTRVNILLNEQVRHIVGQQQTTIDFSESINRKAIILVSLSSLLPPNVKRIIGIILLSELLYAVQARQYLSASRRKHFSIYVDEVQHFAQSDDFATLFTEARKYGIATTIAHQDRFGQLAHNKEMAGATLQAANLICFRLARHDADELAPVFAEAPPTEMRRERELVICEEPLTEMLRGHKNPRINAFIRKRLRPLHEEISDAREDIEGLRLIRMDFLDQIALERLDAQIAGMGRNSEAAAEQHRALTRAGGAITEARSVTGEMHQHYERARSMRGSLREFNRLFTALMEGSIAPGQDPFSAFLFGRVDTGSQIPDRYRPTLELYLSLRYGDPTMPRAIPFELAQTYSLCAETVNALISASDFHTTQDREAFRKQFLEKNSWRLTRQTPPAPVDMTTFKESLIPDAHFLSRDPGERSYKRWLPNPAYKRIWLLPHIYVLYVFLIGTPGLKKLLSPYLRARFAPPYRGFACDIERKVAYIWDCHKRPLGHRTEWSNTYSLMDTYITRKLTIFLSTYRESALVVLSLVAMASRSWSKHTPDDFAVFNNCYLSHRLSMLNFIWIQDIDPIKFLKLLRTANELIRSHPPQVVRYFSNRYYTAFERMRRTMHNDKNIREGGYDFNCPPFPELTPHGRTVVRLLHTSLTERWQTFTHNHPSAASAWQTYDTLTQWYLLNRACDKVYLGSEVAAYTFPMPADKTQLQGIDALTDLLTDVLKEQLAEYNAEKRREYDEEVRKEREEIEQECTEKMAKVLIPPPAYLPARIVDETERSLIIDACYEELSTGKEVGWNADAPLAMIQEFVDFCLMLSKPENHVLIPSGQYVEKQVNTRTERDMADEMARNLRDLKPHTAYARVLVESDGRTQVMKRLIKPPAPLPTFAGEAALQLPPGVYKDRVQIEEEIRQRQAKWRGVKLVGGHSKKPPPIEH